MQQVQRSLEIAGRQVVYDVCRRSGRKRINIRVDAQGVHVRAPVRVALKDIEALLQQHGDWIQAQLAHYLQLHQASERALQDGGDVAYLGQPLRVYFPEGAQRTRWGEDAVFLVSKPGESPGQTLEKVLKPKARAWFLARLAHYADRMGLAMPVLVLSSARSRWGSCNAKGEIRLNWRLIHLAPTLVDYVVVHELAHLKEMNHSPRFWDVVASVYPDWRQARAALKRCIPEYIHLQGVKAL